MTDSHAHLDDSAFDRDRRAVLARAAGAGVSTVLAMGTFDEKNSWKHAFALVDELHPGGEDHRNGELPQLYTTLGCHPHDARQFEELGGEERLRELARRPRLLAIGEVGLDYFYDHSPRAAQGDALRRQIRVARELGLPVVVHHRDAEDDFLRIADEEELASCRAIIHCFTASERFARAAWERGFLISFSGILTFRSAEELRRTAALVPAEHLLVETDCPLLAPVPHRSRRNEPSFVVDTARCLAEVRGVELKEIEAVTDANFQRFFFGTGSPGRAAAAGPSTGAG